MCEVGGWLMFVCLLYCSISDWKNRSVYTWVLIGMSIMALVFCICFSRESGWSIVGGAIIGILFWFISYWTKEAIGYADSWLILILGVYLGVRRLFYLLVGAFCVAAMVSLIGIVCKKWKRQQSIPFIPFLMLAYLGVHIL